MPSEPVVPEVDPPTTLVEWAVLILNTPNPTLKVCPLARCRDSVVHQSLEIGGADATCSEAFPNRRTQVDRPQNEGRSKTARRSTQRRILYSKYGRFREEWKAKEPGCHASCVGKHRAVGVSVYPRFP